MKRQSRAACLYAAVAAVSFGIPNAEARDLVWDWSPGDGVPNDGTGFWDLTSNNWVDQAVPGVNTVWVNGDNATFGSGTAAGSEGTPSYNVDLVSPIVVNNLTLAEVPLDKEYSISNFSGGSLTLNGNLTKAGNDGRINFFCDTTLSAGDHILAMNDTGGNVLEFLFNGVLGGTGNLVVNNGTYQAFGTVGLNRSNTYTGTTSIEKGRIVLTNPNGLGSAAAGTTISNQGTLAIFGADAVFTSSMTLSEPITITRSQYAEAAAAPGGDVEFGRFNGAIQSNAGQNIINGPVVLNTVDARVEVNGGATGATDGLTISSNITETSPSKLSKSGGGVLFLTGTNSHTGGTATIGGTVAFTTDANIGGPTSKMFFDGGYFRVPSTWSNWGAHVVDTTEFAGGIDTPGASQIFTITDNLTGRNFNKRGVGTVNLNGTNSFTEDNFTDLGTVNVNGTTSARAIRIRNGVVNVNNGATYNTTGSFTSIGVDAGEDGVLNISGTGIVNASNNDFNISDNAGIAANPTLGTPEDRTTGVVNVSDSAQLTVAGPIFIAKNARTTATLNISGNAVVNANRGGNPSFVIGQGTAAVGLVNTSGGTLNIAGETFVGNAPGGTGTFTQSAGATTTNNWFVVGRDQSTGTLNLNGGTITKQGGGNTEIDFGGGGQGIVNIRNNGSFIASTGEFWVGSSGGSNGVLNIENAGAVTTNSWTAFGRGGSGAVGTLNMSGTSTFTKATGGGNHFIVADGGGNTGTVNLSNSAAININAGELWVGQGGNSNGTVNINDAGSVTVGNWIAIGRGGTGTVNLSGTGSITKNAGAGSAFIIGAGGTGTLNQTGGTVTHTVFETWIAENGTSGTWNMSGASSVANLGLLNIGRAGGSTATLNLDGGTMTTTRVLAGGGTGAKTVNLNGGLLKVGATNMTDWYTGGIGTNVKAGGAKIDSNGFSAAFNSSLSHDAALGATVDGGLTKSGAGVLKLNAANTYTGVTTVNAGTLTLGLAASLYNNTPASWTDTNIVVNSGAELALGVGGAGSFTASDVDAIKSLGTATGGFRNGSRLGLDTSGGDFTYGSVIANTNGGANAIGFVKRGANALTLTAANTYTGGTTVNAGTLIAGHADAFNTNKPLIVETGATASTSAGLTKAMDLSTLTLVGTGTFDLNDNGLVIRTGSLPVVYAQIKNAFENGGNFDWNGTGIRSTAAAAQAQIDGSTGIGVTSNDNLGYTDFQGVTGLTGTSSEILMTYTFLGDSDLDLDVDGNDFLAFLTGVSSVTGGWEVGDSDYDGDVDSSDFLGFLTGLSAYENSQMSLTGGQVAALYAQAEAGTLTFDTVANAVVPEPATAGVLAMAGVGLLARRRRRA